MDLQHAFEQAKETYPNAYISDTKLVWVDPLFDDEEGEEMEIPHVWQLEDACAASFRTPSREGMLVLREDRPGSKHVRYHWGFMVAKSELAKQPA
jgi:hypothetical protein